MCITGPVAVLRSDHASGQQGQHEVRDAGRRWYDVEVRGGSRALVISSAGPDAGFAESVSVIDTARNEITADAPVERGARSAVFAPDGGRAYVTTETGVWTVDMP